MSSSVTRLPESPELRHRLALDRFEAGDVLESLRLARSLIDEGFPHAYTLAGAILEQGGPGVEQDFGGARFYYERAVETAGAVEGWLGLGRLYFFGKGVNRNLDKATQIYKAVEADAQNPVAQLMLGRIHADPESSMFDPDVARNYLATAAKHGLVFAYAHLAALEGRQGRIMHSVAYRAKAVLLALLISLKDRNSPQLRHS
jgi:TPR repeat protein